MRFFLLLIPLMMGSTLPSYANEVESLIKDCINLKISQASRKNNYVDAGELERFCSCYTNNYVQNLSTRSCPRWSELNKYEIERYFYTN